ncbi:hypothetical protein COV18_06660 [Candidatus Woesearchaeota archaeon CG10_big_fil_rev_8_21_14_0_10_37_12]|nr:MAG: hypothetical protein COV18_06660 [Candidatus Woesearchaeota archaeon CG10_big_fil_rev_8_21_14_0_10_37_12]
MKLDSKDWKILQLLSQNCRQSISKIAKYVGVSREVAGYRIKRLQTKGVIKCFCTEIDFAIFGYTKHAFYIELRNVDEKKEQNILATLKNSPFVSWVVTQTGKWSVIVDLYAKSTDHLNSLLSGFKEIFGQHIGDYEVVAWTSYEYFHSRYFNVQKKQITKPCKTVPDKTDLNILSILRNTARIDLVSLSKIIKITPEAISKRIKKLQQTGAIKQFYIFPDLKKIGLQHYNIQLTLENVNQEQERIITAYLKQHPKISFIHKPIAHWNIECGILVKEPGELRTIMQELRNTYPLNIRIQDTSLFYEEVTSDYLPTGIFEHAI